MGKWIKIVSGIIGIVIVITGLYFAFSYDSSKTNQAQIHVTPKRAMRDVPLEIRLSGFPPVKKVTVRSTTIDSEDNIWEARGVYITDTDGSVNLNEQAPEEGTYKDKDPMGLIWTMAPENKKVEAPYFKVRADQIPCKVTLEAWVDGKIVNSVYVERLSIADGARRIEIRENGFIGILYLPPGEGPFPAITIVSGSGGGVYEPVASVYASHGFAAFSLAYFNYETLPKNLSEIPLEYFKASIDYLQSREDIDSERLAINGASRGGELALLLGSIFPQYKAVIAEVPSGIVWGGWVYKSKPIPFMDTPNNPEIWAYQTDYAERGEPIPCLPGFMKTMNLYPDIVKKAEIPVENINGAVLLVSGGDDQMWPSALFADMVVDRLKRYHFDKPYDHLKYEKAGHRISLPYYPNPLADLEHPVIKVVFANGGTSEANNKASVDSWKKKIEFLKTNL